MRARKVFSRFPLTVADALLVAFVAETKLRERDDKLREATRADARREDAKYDELQLGSYRCGLFRFTDTRRISIERRH